MDPIHEIVVGIDLGTTYSALAYLDDRGRPRAIATSDSKTTLASVVMAENRRVMAVGEVAMNQWIVKEPLVVRWIKRAMGDNDYRFQGLSAVEVSAEILKCLKADAERHFGHPITEAVITCPAYFNSNEIENTKRAGELAGFHVREIIKEPTAAAVCYGVDHMRDKETIMVCDLGGGTFDATILTYLNGTFFPLATMGDRQLGGHDWTGDLVETARQRFLGQFGQDPRTDPVAWQMLYEACEEAKRNFLQLPSATIPCRCGSRIEQITVTRDEFEAATEARMLQLVIWCERALEKATETLGRDENEKLRPGGKTKIGWEDISRILLVGGSSRLRRMALALEEASGKKPVQTAEPDLMVAYGAAMMAVGKARPRRPVGGLNEAAKGGLIDFEYKRIIERSLGTRVIVVENNSARIETSLIIPHGTECPVSRSREDYSVGAGQPFIDVPIVGFENAQEFDVLKSYRFQCLPGAQKGDRIRVTFDYDINGIVTAQATDLKSSRPLVGELRPYEEPNAEEINRRQLKPRWVVFTIDVSGSMSGTKLDTAKQALIQNADQLLQAGGNACQVGIVSFSSNASVVCRPTSNLAELTQAALRMHVSGSTAMHLGIREAVDLVMTAPEGTDRDVVMLTDGMPDDAQATLDAADASRRLDLTLSAIILEGECDVDFIRRVTPRTLEIQSAAGIADAMSTLLTQAAASRGLTDR